MPIYGQNIYIYLRSTIGERNPNPGRSEIEICSVVDGWWMDGHQFSPPEDFCRGITSGGNWYIL